jgi:uncharacterized protein (TIGR00251 family)
MIIRVKVKPNSGKQSVEHIFLPQLNSSSEQQEIYYVKLKALADEGRANMELVKVLKDHFGKNVKIKSGFNSRTKFVEILE